MPPETVVQHHLVWGHVDAYRCCSKSLVGSVLVQLGCASALAEGISFQACAFNDSAISPSRVPTKGQERPTSVTARTSRGRDPFRGIDPGARISVMAATRLGHDSGVESCVGGLLSARLTE